MLSLLHYDTQVYTRSNQAIQGYAIFFQDFAMPCQVLTYAMLCIIMLKLSYIPGNCMQCYSRLIEGYSFAFWFNAISILL